MRPNPTNFSFDQVGKPLNLNQSFQEVSTVANHLRHVVRSQQVLIDALATKQQQTEQKLEYFLERQERISEYCKQREYYAANSVEPDDSIEHCKQEHDSEEERPQIMRRNGFKSPSSDNERSISEKSKKQKRIPSKAKHLWINYGKRIVDYAIENTKGAMQDRIRKLVGKLSTKREYKKLFGVKVNDSDEERQFKIEFGTLAIDFVKNKSAKAFDGARHKDEMIAQWNAVATYIENLISESI